MIKFLSGKDSSKKSLGLGFAFLLISLSEPVYSQRPFDPSYYYRYKSAYTEVYNTCSSFTSSSTRENCKNIIKGGFFDLDAVSFCKTHFYISTQIVDCFAVIKDKIYFIEEVKDCVKNTNARSKILQCLSELGRTVNF